MSFTPSHGNAAIPESPAGVFEADALRPPTPPHGAKAIAIKNADDAVVCFLWVDPRVPDDVILTRCYEFLDKYVHLTRSFGPPRLVP